MNRADILRRNNVRVLGDGPHTLILAHGFGCDQTMWQYLIPHLSDDFTLVLFDYVGSGRSDLSAFSEGRYASLEGYARDIVEMCHALDVREAVLIGHSVSSMIGLLASQSAPGLFQGLVMLSPSPCFLNLPPDYFGGFEREDLEDLVNLMDKNYLGWANFLAPLVLGAQGSDEMLEELSSSFCSTDAMAAKVFARATFFSDYRHILLPTPHRVLIMQSRVDSLAAPAVGRYVHEQMPGSEFSMVDAEGHCLHMTHPLAVTAAIRQFLQPGGAR